MRLIWLVAAGALITGCASATTTGAVPTTDARPTAQAQPNTPDSPPDSPPDPARESPSEPTPTTVAQPCEQVMFQRAQGTIRAQQSAFANQDFRAARAYASDVFRSQVSLPQFESIIRQTYSFLLDEPTLDFLDCERTGNTAIIRVDISRPEGSGQSTFTMVYGVVLENESWFIDGASIADARESVTA